MQPIDVGARLRTQILREGNIVVHFAVSLECELPTRKWARVVNIDNYGGRVHRDRYNPDGTHFARHEEIFDSDDIHLAIQWAKEDLTSNVTRYLEEFRARM